MDVGCIVPLGRGGRQSNTLRWCSLVTILVVLVERADNKIVQFMEGFDIGGENGLSHPAAATAAGVESRRARTVRDNIM